MIVPADTLARYAVAFFRRCRASVVRLSSALSRANSPRNAATLPVRDANRCSRAFDVTCWKRAHGTLRSALR